MSNYILRSKKDVSSLTGAQFVEDIRTD